jgi:peptidylprolyl isomerase
MSSSLSCWSRSGVILITLLLLLLPSAAITAEEGSAAAEKGSTAPPPLRIKHPSGLIVQILSEGEGPEIELLQTAVVHYTGWLDAGGWKKGEKFDSSRDRGRPFAVKKVGKAQVIKGWNQGIPPHRKLAGMKQGERRRLMIPPQLGYGARGAGKSIPPNARLIFDIELLEIR